MTDIQMKQEFNTKSQNKFKAFIKRRSEPILKIVEQSDVPKIKLNS